MKMKEHEEGATLTCECGNTAELTLSMVQVIKAGTGEVKCAHCHKRYLVETMGQKT